MNIKRIASAQLVLLLYLTSDSLTNFLVRILLWIVVFMVIFKGITALIQTKLPLSWAKCKRS